MKVENAIRPAPGQQEAFFARAGTEDDGPAVLVNLLKFREHAAYPDGRDAELSGEEAYMRYGMEVAKLISALGGKFIWFGVVDGILVGECEELWDRVALIEYPSRAAFQAMISSPEYQAIMIHREAGLAGQLDIGARRG
ncbi:conserved hypothetical protein [Parvibaculum lavamentivorans DS-1]|uniref:DUF1330 domain-containing protein n=1 Tax=Parvibaculum lavamentivorans (strain DS-1 / DSM 13023 / NCIMB 13966) TaxID=402881 RepID=A7HS66_PARL1|nr:DUF1330 domain-containing protein [Parvibaculum lavamentivorans]ABS62749.1 conserved hypothetical protein [Parvibaculum lavamentivorans DS-1]